MKHKLQTLLKHKLQWLMLLAALLGVSQGAWAWGWAARCTENQSSENPTYYVGDEAKFWWCLDGTANGADFKRAFIQTSQTSTSNPLESFSWSKDGCTTGGSYDSNNKTWFASATVTSVGTWYYGVFIGWGSMSNGRYYNGNSSWNEGSTSLSGSSFTVKALPDPTSQSSSASGTTATVTWTRNSTYTTVMVVRYTGASPSVTAPTGGTSYSLGSTIGAGTVVYKGTSTTGYSDTGRTAGTTYTYCLYTVNNNYYSSGVSTSVEVPSGCTDPAKPSISNLTVCSGSAPAFSFTSSSTAKYKLYKSDGTCVSDDFTNGTGSSITLTANSTITSNTSYYVQATTTVSGCSNTTNSDNATATVSSGSISKTGGSESFGEKMCGESKTTNFTFSISCGANSFSAAGDGDFTAGTPSVSGTTLTVPVTFSPTATGSRSGTIVISYNNGGSFNLTVNGTGGNLYARGPAFDSWDTPTAFTYNTLNSAYKATISNFSSEFKLLTGNGAWGGDNETLYNAAGWAVDARNEGVTGFTIGSINDNNRNNSNVGSLAQDYKKPAYLYVDVVNKKMWVEASSDCLTPESQTVKANGETSLSVCNGTSVTITTTASQSGFTYVLYEGPTNVESKTGGSALTFTARKPSANTTYYVKAYTTGQSCTPKPVGQVTVTVNAIPSISGTTPGSNCGPGKVTLGATASAGTVNWYSTETGGSSLAEGTDYTTESLSTTTTYYVDATSNGCTTASRTAVTATIKTIPSISGTTPGSRCGAGAVTLGATASAGSVNWYSASTGGSSLKTGTSYTPSISSTKTYYVDATSDGCTTASRTEVVATVNANPSAPVISSYDESVCSGSAPKFTFSSTSGLTYQMYVGSSTSGSSVAGDGSSKTLTAGAITSATTFKLRATNANGCYASSSNAAVSITPNMELTSITLSPSTICTGGESTVTANGLVLGGGSVAYTSSATSKATVAKVSDSEATVSGVAVGSSTITATLSGGCGSNVFQTATITVSAGPAKYILSAAGGTTICSAGGKLRLSGSESSCSYQLYKNGSAYGSPVEGTGSAIEFDVFESGDYECRAYLTSSPSCYTVMTGEVTLHISLTPTLIPATPTVTSYTPVTITSINTDILTWEISGEGNTAYLYDKTSNTVKVKASAAGSPYTITATTSGGCSQTATLTVNADVEKCN